jgi:mono/diheme cytochrome c family protein
MSRTSRSSILLLVSGIALVTLLRVSAPKPLTAEDLPKLRPDIEAGEQLFWAGGCSSCHATPRGERRPRGDERLYLGGGLKLESTIGLFRVPNISTHVDDGIGDWSMIDFVNAVKKGISPGGRHYYPSFPYTSYSKMAVEDIMNIKGYIDGLPAVEGRVPDHELRFPWSIRRGIGIWKRAFLDSNFIVAISSDDALLERGRYLVEGVAHCGECHTPRNVFGAMMRNCWLEGAIMMVDNGGRAPNLTSESDVIASWSREDIQSYLANGMTPDLDSSSAAMVEVQKNIAMLPDADRKAIAAYLKSVRASR